MCPASSIPPPSPTDITLSKNLTCIGAAIATVVTIAEILKNNGLATEKSKVSSLFLILTFV